MDANPAKINRTRQLDQDEQLNLQTHSEFHELEKSACSSGPLGKSAATNYFLLQRACIFAELSTRVYAEKGKVGEVQLLTAVPDPMADAVAAGNAQTAATQPKATLLSLSTSAPVHAIYLVEDLGVVVAFRGTKELEDVLTDASLGPVSITQYDISLHGSIYNAAATSISRIVAGYKEAVSQQKPSARAEVLPLYLTGQQ